MKPQNAQKIWSMIGLFMVVLVLSMPVYSSSALAASVQITKNQGEGEIPNFLDAQDDVWTVEALISGAGISNTSVKPEDVKIKIGDNQATFTSCSPSSLGVLCKYISPLTDGIQEGEYAFQVIYSFLNAALKEESASSGEVIKADGSAPQIFFSPGKVNQDKDGKVKIDFTVNDKKTGVPSAGLKKIDIIDGDTGTILQTIDLVEGKETFSYLNDAGYEGILQTQQLTGEGIKRLKIRAEDNLGHTSFSPSVSFFADFVQPQIGDQLNFTKFGQFIGQFASSTDITVDVIEKSVPMVSGYSQQADLDDDKALCEADADADDLWHCSWKNVEVNPASAVTVLVKVEDEKGNVAEKSLSSSFVVDSSAPSIKFFGTVREFEGKSYLKSGKNRIILQVEDQGAGISEEGIRANLAQLGESNFAEPTACEEAVGILQCYWDINEKIEEGVVTLGLSRFEDNVGNEGLAPEYQFIVDNTGPKVDSLEIFGTSEVGDKDYFQSNDLFTLVLTVSESSGLRMLVNVQDLLLDAENKYPANEFIDEDGWAMFSEQDCTRTEGRWQCSLKTEAIKSGPESNLEVEVRVQDTAGNNALSWPLSENEPQHVKRFTSSDEETTITIDLLGLTTEENPDFWEVRKVTPLGSPSAFIDLDTTPLTYTRLPFKVSLNSDISDVKALSIELVNCAAPGTNVKKTTTAVGEEAPVVIGDELAPAPVISRTLLYGGVSATGDDAPAPNVIIEFEPFDGRTLFQIGQNQETEFVKKQVEYLCTFKIFSQVGKNAVRAAEVQEAKVVVPFAFSTLGAQDENLDQIIKDAREDINTAWDVIGVLAEILKWLDYLIQVYNIIMSIVKIFEGPGKFATEAVKNVPTGGEAARIAACFGFTGGSKGAEESGNIFDAIIQVLSCRPGSVDLGWYGTWQSSILDIYNVEILKAPDDPLGKFGSQFRPARSIQDNLFLSFAGLCIPGIIKNVDKFRQIKCRKIMCLENEVRSGLATVAMCEDLEDLLVCKYVVGELWYIIPFSQFWDKVIKGLADAFTGPFAILHTTTFVTCGILCLTSNPASGGCTYAYFIWEIVDTLENIVGFITTVVEDFGNGGLNYCDAVGEDVI